MTNLDERIAKRKADGWVLSHWVVKRFDGLYASSCAWTSVRNAAHPFFSEIEAREKVHTGPSAKPVPVFVRTIRTKRGHSFSWALARMKEGKTVRRKGRPELLAMREGWLVEFYENTKVHSLNSCHIEASDWELAE